MRILFSVTILLTSIFSAKPSWANTCDPQKLKYTKEAYELVDRDYINKMLMKDGYHHEIEQAIQDYKKFYGDYPLIIDNKSGLPLDRRLGGVAPDGKWLVVDLNGKVSWIYNPRSAYSLFKKNAQGQKAEQFNEGQTVWSKEKERYGKAFKVAHVLGDGSYVVTTERGVRVIRAENLSATYIKDSTAKPKGRVIQIQPAK